MTSQTSRGYGPAYELDLFCLGVVWSTWLHRTTDREDHSCI